MNFYAFSTERSSLLGTEAFRNLLGEALKNAKKILRWKAKIKFYDGLKKTIRFYKNERKNVG